MCSIRSPSCSIPLPLLAAPSPFSSGPGYPQAHVIGCPEQHFLVSVVIAAAFCMWEGNAHSYTPLTSQGVYPL